MWNVKHETVARSRNTTSKCAGELTLHSEAQLWNESELFCEEFSYPYPSQLYVEVSEEKRSQKRSSLHSDPAFQDPSKLINSPADNKTFISAINSTSTPAQGSTLLSWCPACCRLQHKRLPACLTQRDLHRLDGYEVAQKYSALVHDIRKGF